MTNRATTSRTAENVFLIGLLAAFLIGFVIFMFIIFSAPSSSAESVKKLMLSDNYESDSLQNAKNYDLSFLRVNSYQSEECLLQEGSDRDTDDDAIADSCDNCPYFYNPFQEDGDKDGKGDVCDLAGDSRSRNPRPDIECERDSDCGTDGYIGSLFCANNNVTRVYKTYTCNDAGTEESYCTSSRDEQTIEVCTDACQNGECTDIACRTDAECNDNNALTLDVCNFPNTPQSYCSNTPFSCSTDSQCGTDGFVGAPFCQGNNIFSIFKDYTCNAPGSLGSYCSSINTNQQTNTCPYACTSGQCIRCDSNSDCNDNNSSTNDICILPGSLLSSCQNNPNPTECTPGASRNCGPSTDVGICEYGTQTCSSSGTWGQCIGPVYPLPEVCDTQDNDCDSQVDEGNVCGPVSVCGNGNQEPGEQCDDGNTNNGDGCSSSCQIEIPSCTNECTQGATQCVNSGASRICANFDADPCTEWSLPASCGSGSTCVNGACN